MALTNSLGRPRWRSLLRLLVVLVLAVLIKTTSLAAQGEEPLPRADLLRILSSGVFSKPEIAELISRNCLAFEPTDEDRQQFRLLGATPAIMLAIEECAQRSVPLRVAPRANRVTEFAGGRTTVVVRVTRGDRPAAGVELALLGSGSLPGGQDTDARAISSQEGWGVFQFPVGTVAGIYRLTVGTLTGERIEGDSVISLIVEAQEVLSAEVTPEEVRFERESQATVALTVALRDRYGNPVAGQQVQLRASSADIDIADSDKTTDERGEAVFTVAGGDLRESGWLQVNVGEDELALVPVSLGPGALSTEQTGFVSGADLVGTVAMVLPNPLVLALRDEQGSPIPGREVLFSATNASVFPRVATSDSAGRASVTVRLGIDATQRATVVATVEGVQIEASIRVEAGSPARFIVTRDGTPVAASEAYAGLLGRPEAVLADTDESVTLRVTAEDAFGNAASVAGLLVAIADERILSPERVATDSSGASVVLRPVRQGLTRITFELAGLTASLLTRLLPFQLPYFTGYSHLYGAGSILAPNAYIAPGPWDLFVSVGAAFPEVEGSRPVDEGASAIFSWRGRAEFGITAYSDSEFGVPARVQILPPTPSGLAVAVGALNLVPVSDEIGRHGLLGASEPYTGYIDKASPYVVASLARRAPASPLGYLVSLGWGAGMFLKDNIAYSSAGYTSGFFGAAELDVEASPGLVFRLALEHDGWDTHAATSLLWRGLVLTIGVLGIDEGSADLDSNALNQTRVFLRFGASLRQSREWLGS